MPDLQILVFYITSSLHTFHSTFPQVAETLLMLISIYLVYRLLKLTIKILINTFISVLKWSLLLYFGYILYSVFAELENSSKLSSVSSPSSSIAEIDQIIVVASKTLWNESVKVYNSILIVIRAIRVILFNQQISKLLLDNNNFWENTMNNYNIL